MGRKQRRTVPSDLARARDRFAAWRRTRKPKARIPEPLWALAARLVASHGMHRTSSTLKLDYYSLKRRVEAASATDDTTAPAFVELESTAAIGRQCVIEFADGTGVVLRMQLTGYGANEVVAVGRSLREAP